MLWVLWIFTIQSFQSLINREQRNDNNLSDSLHLYNSQPDTQQYDIIPAFERNVKGKWLPCEYGLYTGCLCPNKKRQSLSAVSEQTLFDGQIKC